MIGRKPRVGENEFKTALITMFAKNNPHKCAEVPTDTVEIENIEKVRIKDLVNISYYLEGNDMVINDLEEVSIEQDGSILTLRGKQSIQ